MNRFEKSKEVYNQLFGQLPKNENDPEFMDILRKFIFCDIFSEGNLEERTRELITITALSVLQSLPQLKAHIGAGLNIGLLPVEIRESIYQLAPFIGFPRTLNAISVMNEVFEQKGFKLPLQNMGTTTDDNRFEKGFAIQYPIYGDEIKNRYSDMPEVPKFLTEFGFGDFYTRKGLDIKTRELLILVALTALGQTGPAKSHIEGNLKVGNKKETMVSAIIQCIPYLGFTPCFAILNLLNEIK